MGRLLKGSKFTQLYCIVIIHGFCPHRNTQEIHTIVCELFQILKQYSGDHLFCDAHEYKSRDNQIKTSLMLYKRTIVSGVKFPVTTSYADSQVLYLNLCK